MKNFILILLATLGALFTLFTPELRFLDDLPIPVNLDADLGEPIPIDPHHLDFRYMIPPYFWPGNGRAYAITNADMTWEAVKTEYTDLLTSFTFSQLSYVSDDLTTEHKYEQFELMVWRRYHAFGMDSELIAVAWIEDGKNPPQVVIFFGPDH